MNDHQTTWVAPLKVNRTKPLVRDRIDKIRRLVDEGLSHAAIAHRLGLSRSSVLNALRASRAIDDAAAGHREPR
jgi:DNA invertase Pin-like site-specific DNA recombinase